MEEKEHKKNTNMVPNKFGSGKERIATRQNLGQMRHSMSAIVVGVDGHNVQVFFFFLFIYLY